MSGNARVLIGEIEVSEDKANELFLEPETPVMEYTVALIKPPAVGRGDVHAIMSDITRRGFTIHQFVAKELCETTRRAFYQEHVGRPYFDGLMDSMKGTTVAMVLFHPLGDTVARWREAIGSTDATKAAVGTLRNLYGGFRFNAQAPMADNALHGSGSAKEAEFEQSVIFGNLT